jgi:hypothetical protein
VPKYLTAVLSLLLAFLGVLTSTLPAHAQSLPLGTVTAIGDPYPCSGAPNGSDFYSPMNCINATIHCPNIADIGIVYGSTGPTSPKGTIVIFNGGPGMKPTDTYDEIPNFVAIYAAQYVTIQMEYTTAWEDPSSNGSGGNLLAAACRPATFLNYINNSTLHSTGAMCAQGASAGSAQIAYSMAWYGAASYLTNVELVVGPVFSEIDKGCTYPNAATPTVCAAGTTYCSPKTLPWSDAVIYVPMDNSYVSAWSGLPACATSSVNSANYPLWAAMSIVDGSSSGATPTFNYSSTIKRAWLCSSLNQTNCGNSSCPNNTSSQGKYFYDAINATADTNLEVTGLTGCVGAEGISTAIDPDSSAAAYTAITTHMLNNCIAPK